MSFQKQTSSDPRPFWIGRVDNVDYWTNIAIAHERGTLRNENLLKMTDEQLINLCQNGESRIAEEYRRGDSKSLAERQGGEPNETYIGCHRAQVILDYRRAKKIEDAKIRNQDNKEAFLSLSSV